MILPNCLHQGPHGEIRFVGSRIDLYFVVEAYSQGWPAEAIALRYDSVRLVDVHTAIEFYLANRADVDAYVQECDRLYEELQAQAPKIDFDELRVRLAARDADVAAKAAG